MKNKLVNFCQFLLQLIPSILLIVAGIMLLIRLQLSGIIVYYLLLCYLILSFIVTWLQFLKTRQMARAYHALFLFGIAIICWLKPITIRTFLNVSVGIFSIVYGLIRFVDYYALRKNGSKGILLALGIAITSFVMGIILIMFYFYPFHWFYRVTGIYLIVKGFVDLARQIGNALLRHNDSNYNRLSVSAPVFLCALLPIRFYADIKKLITNHQITQSNIQPQAAHTVEIWIHLNSKGFEQFGHVDISYNNKVYSYGAHDPASREVFGAVGLGVLMVVDRHQFLDYCINAKEMVVSFTLELTKDNEHQLQQRIDALMALSKPYDCFVKQELSNGQEPTAHDYASRVYLATKANMYTFTSGKFKTYYVFSTNCVLLADELLRCDQFNLLQLSGLITPGSYLSYLYQELHSETSYVKKLDVYCD